jgi:hypothetical protein
VTKESPVPASRTQSASVGRDAVGLVQNAGDSSRLHVTASAAPVIPLEVLNAFAAIEEAFAVNPATRALAGAAAAEVKTEEPDKGAIAKQLEAALQVAKSVPGWRDIAEKIGPHVRTAVEWLGAQGTALLDRLE